MIITTDIIVPCEYITHNNTRDGDTRIHYIHLICTLHYNIMTIRIVIRITHSRITRYIVVVRCVLGEREDSRRERRAGAWGQWLQKLMHPSHSQKNSTTQRVRTQSQCVSYRVWPIGRVGGATSATVSNRLRPPTDTVNPDATTKRLTAPSVWASTIDPWLTVRDRPQDLCQVDFQTAVFIIGNVFLILISFYYSVCG